MRSLSSFKGDPDLSEDSRILTYLKAYQHQFTLIPIFFGLFLASVSCFGFFVIGVLSGDLLLFALIQLVGFLAMFVVAIESERFAMRHRAQQVARDLYKANYDISRFIVLADNRLPQKRILRVFLAMVVRQYYKLDSLQND